MPEIREEDMFKIWILLFIAFAKANLGPDALKIKAIHADFIKSELDDLKNRENRLLIYARTLTEDLFAQGFHRAWAVRMESLALAIPDTNGLMINEVRAAFPPLIRDMLSANHSSWHEFREAICALEFGQYSDRCPSELPEPWFMNKELRQDYKLERPSSSLLTYQLNHIIPPTWRGHSPDRRPFEQRPQAVDTAWEEPLIYPVPSNRSQPGFDILGNVPPPYLAPLPSSRGKKKGKKTTTVPTAAPPPATQSQPKVTDFFKTTASSTTSTTSTPKSMNGISSKLASLGGRKLRKRKKGELYTERDIDHSLYMWPLSLIPSIRTRSSLTDADLELMGLEHDTRDIVLDLKHCFLEIEPLLHSSPQIFTAEDWEGVSRVPADKRGFKVVIALEMSSHTLAWVSKDANCRAYWFSRPDIESVRPHRVPHILWDYWNWCKFTVKWLRQWETVRRLDDKTITSILSGSGNHPWRGVGRYTLDELAARSGIPLTMLFRELLKRPEMLLAFSEQEFLFAAEQWQAADEMLAECRKLNSLRGPNSWLLITTNKSVLRYNRMLSVYKQSVWLTSSRTKRLVERYNYLSSKTYDAARNVAAVKAEQKRTGVVLPIPADPINPDDMSNAPWCMDLAELAPSLLLFGHTGPTIVGGPKIWDSLFKSEAIAATTKEMRNRFAYFNSRHDLTAVQKLMLKPVVDLSPAERELLVADFGGSINPLVDYLEKRRKFGFFRCESLPAIHASVLEKRKAARARADLPSKRRKTATTAPSQRVDRRPEEDEESDSDDDEVFGGALPDLTDDEDEDKEEDGENEEPYIQITHQFVDPLDELPNDDAPSPWVDEEWTLIRDINRAKIKTRLCKSGDGSCWTVFKPPRSTVKLSEDDEPIDAFREKVDAIRWLETLTRVKENTRLHTVGFLDFCGHATAFKVGRGWIIAPCRWHPSLTRAQQQAVHRSWMSIGIWRVGYPKFSKTAMKKEVTLRKEARDELKGKKYTAKDLTKLVRRKRAAKRVEEKLQQAKKAAVRAEKKTQKRKGKGKGVLEESHPAPMTFRSERLNELGGDEQGRMRLKHRALETLGIKRRAGRGKVEQ
ncbi:hypothetical protein R3P38DRAFT_2947347 [Favolaschia claudopus]|uniref:Uncharacterized protein n=1 Tax=Favolaschia claudopus TaxID=2862362 RepID=A0AAW0BJT4_9AGAR